MTTNKELSRQIGDLGGEIAGLSDKIDVLQEASDRANGRQRKDHDIVLAVKAVQDNCPTRTGNPGPEKKETPWSLAKWGLKECGVFGTLAVVILGLMAIILNMQGMT